jgi:tight adherence protein C
MMSSFQLSGVPPQVLLLIALTIGCTLAAVWTALGSRGAAVKARLKAIRTDSSSQAAHVSVITEDAPQNFWERIFIALGKRQESKKEASKRAPLRTLLRHAGFRRPTAVSLVLGVRIALTIGLPTLAAPLAFAHVRGQTAVAVLLLAVPAVLGYLLPGLVVARLADARKRHVDSALPETLDLLVLCMEAGLGLNAAIFRVAEERSNTDDPLGQELAVLAHELGASVSRKDALQNLADRAGSEDLRTIVAQLVHTERLGGNVGPALRAQAESLRAAHKLRAEEMANRLPIKMLLPTVMFMPALFITIIAPVVLRIIATLNTSKVVP